MRTTIFIACLIYPMVQAVLFGVGMVVILTNPAWSEIKALIPIMIGATSIISVPIAAWIAPRMRARRRVSALGRSA